MCDLTVGVFSGPGCEKTTITLRYLKNEFIDANIPSTDDEFSKVIEVDNKTVNLYIIDTAGQDDFKEMRYCYYTKIQAAILVFDISNPSTIDAIKSIYEDIKDAAENDVVFAIAANRGYLRDENNDGLVSTEIYKDLEKHFNAKVFETNAKTGKNVQEIFQYITKQYLSSLEKEKFPKDKKQKKSPIVLTTNIQNSSQDLLKKRSTSFVPKMMNKKKLDQESNENTKGNDFTLSSSVFGSPIGAEIKSILQSRTKQLQIALEEKKELEKKLLEREDELRIALLRIRELEKQLNILPEEKEDEILSPHSRKHSRKSDLADYKEDSKHKKEKRRSLNPTNLSDYTQEDFYKNISDDDQKEFKSSKKSSSRKNLTDDCINEDEEYKKKKSTRKRGKSEMVIHDSKKAHKKIGCSKSEPDSSRLTVERLKELAHPNDIFSKKIRVFRTDEIDQLKKVKEIGRGAVDEVIKVTRKQVMAMIVFDLNVEVEKLLKQYELLNQLKHPNIIKSLGCCFGDESHKPSMLFEYLSSSLRKFVKKLSNEEKISVIFEVADAIKQANFYGVPHLNLNPDNILIGPDNHAKVTDFGISSLIHSNSKDELKQKFPSSAIFMPPEQLKNDGDVNDELVDVYSFGVVAYFIISNGELPPKGENDEIIDLSSFPECFNEYAKALVSKCCSVNPDSRPSLADLVIALEESLDLIDGVDIAAIKNRILQFH